MERKSVIRGFGMLGAALLTGLFASAAVATTATYSLSSSGGTGILTGNAIACTSVATCLAGTPDFANLTLEAASGTLDIVDSGSPGFPSGTLSLSIPSITLSGGPLGGLDEIVLSSLSVSFSFAAFDLLESPAGAGLLSIVQIGVPATATLTGTVEGLLAGGTVVGPMPLSETVTLSALNCVVAPGQCGFQLNFSSLVGSPLEFRITGNLNAVPEPGLALLVGFGLVAAGARRRS